MFVIPSPGRSRKKERGGERKEKVREGRRRKDSNVKGSITGRRKEVSIKILREASPIREKPGMSV